MIVTIAPAISPAADLPPPSVLIFDGSEPNSPWGVTFRDALRTTINANTPAPVAIYSEILDLSRFNPKGYEEALRTLLREKYQDKPIGLIVAHGSLALEVLMRLRTEFWSDVPVMFAVVDEAFLLRADESDCCDWHSIASPRRGDGNLRNSSWNYRSWF